MSTLHKNIYQELRAFSSAPDGRPVKKRTPRIWYFRYYGKENYLPPGDDLTKEQEARCWSIRRRSAKARDQIVRQYLPFAFKMACKMSGPRLPKDEAISAANAGLMEAIEGYDHTSGTKFLVYGFTIIRRHLINALVATYCVKVTDKLRKRYNNPDAGKLQKLVLAGEPKTLEELFERLSEAAPFDVTHLFERQEDAPFMPAEEVSPDEAFDDSTLSGELREAMNKTLFPSEKTIVQLRYFKSPPVSFEKIARKLHVSKVKVKAQAESAMAKLRAYMTA